MDPVRIGVSPPSYRDRLDWLFGLLEQAYNVRFCATSPERIHAGGAGIVFHEEGEPPPLPPAALLYMVDASGPAATQELSFTRDPLLDGRFHGRTLTEKSLPLLRPLCAEGARVLCSSAGGPVWVRRETRSGRCDVVRLPGGDWLSRVTLWENLQDQRFFIVLTLVHFLKSVLGDSGWRPPPLRAVIMVDDPNLRTMRYGEFRFADVVDAARRHRFHVSIGVSPIDLPATSRAVVEFIRRNADVLSLSIHGNDHTHYELLRITDEGRALAVASQMLRRVERFENRHRLRVSRVVVPPNELASEHFVRALGRLPFDAMTSSRPFPWLPPNAWTSGAGPDDGLLAWFPGSFVAGGFPIIRRSGYARSLVQRAFLDQPLIRYFHHGAFSGGMVRAIQAADEINTLGKVRWMSLEEIALSNLQTRLEGGTLWVRPFSRRVQVEIPRGVRELRVALPAARWEGPPLVARVDGRPAVSPAAPTISVIPGSTAEIALVRDDAVDHRAFSDSRAPLPAWLHRRAGEAVDRLRLR